MRLETLLHGSSIDKEQYSNYFVLAGIPFLFVLSLHYCALEVLLLTLRDMVCR